MKHTDTPPAREGADDEACMALLHGHVPLSLLLDIARPAGPSSEEILVEEGEPLEHWWEPRA
ncbi:MAG: hypothetical protein M3Q27_09870 [Actinomycetota bacterium]|nr:hypothetical protein [Actinomycetota bacterium]